MSSVCWTRVDDRLLHGQVTVGWRQYLRYRAVCVVDDETGSDPFLQEVLRLAAPDEVTVRVYTVEEAITALATPATARTLILVKTPHVALLLVEGGVALAQLNVGNVAPGPGSVRVFRSISLNDGHVAALDALAARGVQITFQLTPDDARADWPTVRQRYVSARRG
jgi:mannose/fructose/N-acetylgalactosamine-specific phosphotransferase system component IIB